MFKVCWDTTGTNPDIAATSENLCITLQSLHKDLQNKLILAQKQQATYYNKHHRPTPDYKVGEYIYLYGRNIKTLHPSEKLDYKRLSPFKIFNKVGSHAYKLELPDSMKIHPVFHVNLLTPKKLFHLPDITVRVVPPRSQLKSKAKSNTKWTL
ncbi:hypothetical protein G6F46_008780 [Rhizopus delemar]|nr:hypothetical protein G6F46_008780 [Rhizopus delemar]